MNGHMIRILMRKDLHLVGRHALTYLTGGVLALGLMAAPSQGAYYAGVVLLVTVLMALGVHPALATSVGERKAQTLAFVMSLPITPADYTLAKLAINLLLFFVPWCLLLLGCTALIHLLPSLPDGLIPLATVLFGVIGAGAVVILCVAIVTESVALTILVQVGTNLVFQGVMYGAANDPAIKANLGTDTVAWPPSALAYLGAYLAVAFIALTATVWLQSRKTTFI